MKTGIRVYDARGVVSMDTTTSTARYLGQRSFTITSYNHALSMISGANASRCFVIVSVINSPSRLSGSAYINGNIIEIHFMPGFMNGHHQPPANGQCIIDIFEI